MTDIPDNENVTIETPSYEEGSDKRVPEDIESDPEMKLCKYVLRVEGWWWSLLATPVMILAIIAKYINSCCVRSICRIGFIPGSIIGTYYLINACNHTKSDNWGILLLGWAGVLILLVMIILDSPEKEIITMKKGWLWKEK